MLEWKINNSDNALRKEIKRCQDTFDRWFGITESQKNKC